MLEKIYGKAKSPAIESLVNELDNHELNGSLYVGYPILATADDAVSIDALLICDRYGLVAFSIPPWSAEQHDSERWATLQEDQTLMFRAIDTNLGKHKELWKGRELAIPINTITLLPERVEIPSEHEGLLVASPDTLSEALAQCRPFEERYARAVNAALQRVTNIKPLKKRLSVSRSGSRGDVIKSIERQIANLDQWQKRAAIETPDGPQRVRGLAGSGKTVVLALKAAYLHFQNPDWNIALTFYSRSLYQQLTDLVRRFSYEHLGEEPDWTKIRILHAWGSSYRPGVYSEMASQAGMPYRDYLYAKNTYGRQNAFTGICSQVQNMV